MRVLMLAIVFGSAAVAQTAAPKPVMGTVASFKVESLEFGVRADTGGVLMVKVGPETDVVAIQPGERDLTKAKPAKLTDIGLGDRVLASYVRGLPEARRIVLISAEDIAKRNEAERLDWQQRGISGIVTSATAGEIAIEMRSPGKVKTAILKTTGKTLVRRYAPDSVKFTNALPSQIGEIAPGDQVQARGQKTADGLQVTAEEIVFGTFVTKVGTVSVVNVEAGEIRIQDVTTKETLTVRVTTASQLKALPDMRAMFLAMLKSGKQHDGPPAPPEGASFDIKKTLEQLPAASLADVKPGTSVIVTSTRGKTGDQLTAIMLLANADSLIQAAQAQSGGSGNAVDAISSMHGGMLAGPGGLALPAILQ